MCLKWLHSPPGPQSACKTVKLGFFSEPLPCERLSGCEDLRDGQPEERTTDGVKPLACRGQFEDKQKGKLLSAWVVNIRSLLTPSDRLAGTFQGSRRVQRNVWLTLQLARKKALDLAVGGGLRGGSLGHPSASPGGQQPPKQTQPEILWFFSQQKGIPNPARVCDAQLGSLQCSLLVWEGQPSTKGSDPQLSLRLFHHKANFKQQTEVLTASKILPGLKIAQRDLLT